MKHAHVADTLTYAPAWAVLADPVCEALDQPERAPLVWDGETWAEIDPQTGDVLCRGTIGCEAAP